MNLMKTFRIFAGAAMIALVALMLFEGEPMEPSWWPGASLLALWVIGPTAAPYLLAKRQSRRWFSIAMFLYFLASSIASGLIYHVAFFRSTSSTAALVMVIIPLYQWIALALLLLVCLVTMTLQKRKSKSA
jgi:hypothetical protein